jgi:5'-nucleotidase
MKKRPRILVVNDDGIHGEGLAPLLAALEPLGEVTALVPERERSAVSHGLTLHKPLRLKHHHGRVYRLNGGPADCARLGTLSLLKRRVDLIVSGINRGFNLGQDTVYSGTVAGAMEGTMLGVPAFAVSRGVSARPDYAAAAAFARRLAEQVLRRGLPRGVCLNVNAPALPSSKVRGARVTRLGERIYTDSVAERKDPSGRPYYWLMGRSVRGVPKPGTDVAAVARGYIAVTPLEVDKTHAPLLSRLRAWNL